MTKIVKQFEVEASPDKVFAIISVPEKWPQWASFVKRASSVGLKTHWVYDMGGMKVESDTQVSDVKENKVYEFCQTKGFMKDGGTRFDIKTSKKGSSITWTTEYELPYSYLGRLADKLRAKKQFDKAIDKSVSSLKQVLER